MAEFSILQHVDNSLEDEVSVDKIRREGKQEHTGRERACTVGNIQLTILHF